MVFTVTAVSLVKGWLGVVVILEAVAEALAGLALHVGVGEGRVGVGERHEHLPARVPVGPGVEVAAAAGEVRARGVVRVEVLHRERVLGAVDAHEDLGERRRAPHPAVAAVALVALGERIGEVLQQVHRGGQPGRAGGGQVGVDVGVHGRRGQRLVGGVPLVQRRVVRTHDAVGEAHRQHPVALVVEDGAGLLDDIADLAGSQKQCCGGEKMERVGFHGGLAWLRDLPRH
ncbi:MAG: hypothetical protein QM765_53675 [Myxococcales bacterium]